MLRKAAPSRRLSKTVISDLGLKIEFPFEVSVLVPDEEEKECLEESERHQEYPIPCRHMDELIDDKE